MIALACGVAGLSAAATAGVRVRPALAFGADDVIYVTSDFHAWDEAFPKFAGYSDIEGVDGYVGSLSALELYEGDVVYALNLSGVDAPEPGSYIEYYKSEKCTGALAWCLQHGYPNTSTICGRKLSDGKARFITQAAIAMLMGEEVDLKPYTTAGRIAKLLANRAEYNADSTSAANYIYTAGAGFPDIVYPYGDAMADELIYIQGVTPGAQNAKTGSAVDCSVCSFTHAVILLTGDYGLTPEQYVGLMYSTGGNWSWGSMKTAAQSYGVIYETIPKDVRTTEFTRDALASGEMIIISQHKGVDAWFIKPNGDAHKYPNGHTIMFYKYQDGIFWAKDSARQGGAMCPYSKEAMADFLAKSCDKGAAATLSLAV